VDQQINGILAMWPFEKKSNVKNCCLIFFVLIPGSAIQRFRTAEGDDEGHADTLQSTAMSTSIS
jgi:hypothetical protein